MVLVLNPAAKSLETPDINKLLPVLVIRDKPDRNNERETVILETPL